MASITEILTLVLILSCILILPRMFRQEKQKSQKKITPENFSVYQRFGIVVSILLPIISALVLKPWKSDVILFISIGILPVVVGWGIVWMISGLKKNN